MNEQAEKLRSDLLTMLSIMIEESTLTAGDVLEVLEDVKYEIADEYLIDESS